MPVPHEKRRQFKVSEYYRMAEAGVLSPEDRVELIEGEVITMSPIGSRHAACVRRLDASLTRSIPHLAIVSIQSPIAIDEYSEPEPDVALLKPRDNYYSDRHPRPEDVLLVIEVAETSLEYDRLVKLPLYARAGIPEAWLVNLSKDVIEVHTEPVNGVYQACRIVTRGETIASLVLTELTIETADLF
jgi:Uma2 family endonuclease